MRVEVMTLLRESEKGSDGATAETRGKQFIDLELCERSLCEPKISVE